MSHFGTIHSLDDTGLPGLYVTHTNPVTFEFDNFGVTHQRVSAETLAATAHLVSSPPDVSEQLQNLDQNAHLDSRGETAIPTENDIPESDIYTQTGGTVEQLEQVAISEQTQGAVPETNEGPVIDIAINNVVCSYSTRCHLDLKRIAMTGMNVIHKKESGVRTLNWSS